MIRKLLVVSFFAASGWAQAPAAPPLLGCGAHGEIQIVCGVKAPEDLEWTPDGKHLVVSQYPSFRTTGQTAELVLFDVTAKKALPLAVAVEPMKGWGDPACQAPKAIAPHGTSLGQRRGGAWQLYVVNHEARESVEMYELRKAGTGWSLVWRGCVTSPKDFNDVAVLADGSFVGTHPTGLNQPGAPQGNAFGGQPTGYVVKWEAGKGETEMPGTRLSYPNGVNASRDGRTLYINVFGGREVAKYDVASAKVVGTAKVNFMPDNLTWMRDGRLLAAGVKGARGNCPETSTTPCIQAFGIALIDPKTMQAREVFDSKEQALISGVSVAIEGRPGVWVGAFQGDRLVWMPMKELAK